MITSEIKSGFATELTVLITETSKFTPKNTLQTLEHFENKLSLDELLHCFSNKRSSSEHDLENFDTRLLNFFSQRWQRIYNTNMCYTTQPHNAVNQFCLKLAKALAGPGKGSYDFLMPTLINSSDVEGRNINQLGLNEFILSDDGAIFIPVFPCLHRALNSVDGRFRHVVARGTDCFELTPGELRRLTGHSKPAHEIYTALLALNEQRFLGNDLGTRLRQLAVALQGGSTCGTGMKTDAGDVAYQGIFAFYQYWETLPISLRTSIFAEHEELAEILGRLFRPADVNYLERKYSVRVLAEALAPIIARYDNSLVVDTFRAHVVEKEQSFTAALHNSDGFAPLANKRTPRHILATIFKLDKTIQKAMFSQAGYANALHYALAYQPQALLEFELNDAEKTYAASAAINAANDCGFIVAAKLGEVDALKLLVTWGADIEHQDGQGSRALHWAAREGHVAAVQYLLAQGASLEAGGKENDTALNFAVKYQRETVVNVLLANQANVNAKNKAGKNAFYWAFSVKNQVIINSLLLYLVNFSAQHQIECLAKINEFYQGECPNVLFYAVIHQLALFDTLLDKVLVQPEEHSLTIRNTLTRSGCTLLMYVVQTEEINRIKKLLSLGARQLSQQDTHQYTALHWAAIQGKTRVVNYLIEQGAWAVLEEKTLQGETPLHLASYNKHADTVNLLIEHDASIQERDNVGNNALDIAIATNSTVLESLLYKIAGLNQKQQLECLNNVQQGRYPNVLFYVVNNKTDLFTNLLDKVLKQPQESRRAILNALDRNNCTLLMLAARVGATERVKKLVIAGVTIDVYDVNGYTALHWAAMGGHVDVVRCLITWRASLRVTTKLNETALHLAMYRNHLEVIKLFFAHIADIQIRDNAGFNAVDIAIATNSAAINLLLQAVALLTQEQQATCLSNVEKGRYPNVLFYAADNQFALLDLLLDKIIEQPRERVLAILNTINSEGISLLMLVARLGAVKSLEKLLAWGLPIELRDTKQQHTALHWAVMRKHFPVVECLLKAGASLETKNKENKTALDLAVQYGASGIAKLLRNMYAKNDNAGLPFSINYVAANLLLAPVSTVREEEEVKQVKPGINGGQEQ